MKQIISLFLLTIAAFVLGACSEEEKSQPIITSVNGIALPSNCDVYHLGEEIPVRYLFKDADGLGDYNISVHHNFDHHSHSTEVGECELDLKKNADKNVWIYSESFSVPNGAKEYATTNNIRIPKDIQTGDYHFMIRLTDKVGYQEIKAVSIKIMPAKP